MKFVTVFALFYLFFFFDYNNTIYFSVRPLIKKEPIPRITSTRVRAHVCACKTGCDAARAVQKFSAADATAAVGNEYISSTRRDATAEYQWD